MSAKRIIFIALIAAMAAVFVSCKEDNGIQAPPTPPQLSLTRYTRSSGLPNDDVYDILTDSQGRTWVTTNFGVGLIENNTVRKFLQADGLIHLNCRSVVEFDGKIWIGTWGGGVAIYDNGTWSSIGTSDGLVSGYIYDIAVDDTSLWFATDGGGVSQYNPVTGKFVKYVEQSPPNKWTAGKKGIFDDMVISAVSMGVGADGSPEVWFGSEADGITVWHPLASNATYYVKSSAGLPASSINDIFYDAVSNKFWVSFSMDGLASMDIATGTWTHYLMSDGLPSETVYSIAQDSSGTIWVGTNGGIAKLEGSRFEGFTTANGLPEARVRRVYVDPENHVWMGFVEGGVAKLN